MRSLTGSIFTAAMLCIALLAPASASWNASLSGTVVDIKSLQAVPDATIRAYDNNGITVVGEATSDAKGAFVINGLRGGYYRLQFSRGGYQRTVISGVWVHPGERMIEAAPIAMYPNGVKLPNMAVSKPCGSVVDPSQTADVYIVCSE